MKYYIHANTFCSLLLVASTLIPSLHATAQVVSEAEALQRARSFFGVMQQSPHRGAHRGQAVNQELELMPSSEVVANDSLYVDSSGQRHEAFYVVQPREGDEGYVIVAADQRQYSILGYSYTGHFDNDELGETARGWLTHYATEMRALSNVSALSAPPQAWNMLNVLPIKYEGVEALTKTSWGQNTPYNNMCPDPNERGEHCLTGCVATAMAQMMKHYNYPAEGKGSYSYSSGSHTYSATFEGTKYDWQNMLDSYSTNYTQEQADAVAQLMWHCGVSVTMGYGYRASGASTSNLASSLRKYFGYDRDIVDIESENGIDVEWHRMLLHELNQNRPLVYATLSHCFILDGYEVHDDTDAPYYHMNLGWNDLYHSQCYLLTSIPSLGDYTPRSRHEMILGIVPEDDRVLPYYYVWRESGFPTAVQLGVTQASDVSITFGLKSGSSFNDVTDAIDCRARLISYRQDGVQTVVGEWEMNDIKNNRTLNATIDFGNLLTLGHHVLEWRIYRDETHYTVVDHEPLQIEVFRQEPQLCAEVLSLPEIIEAQGHTIVVELTNRGSEPYYGSVIEMLVNANDKTCSKQSINLNLQPGQSQQVVLGGMMSDLVSGPAILYLMDSYMQQILVDTSGEPLSFEVETQPLVPEIQFYYLSVHDRKYIDNYSFWPEYIYTYASGEVDQEYDGEWGLVAVDADDNVLEEFTKGVITFKNNCTYMNQISLYNTTAFKNMVYYGHLPNGTYRVRIFSRQKNTQAWTTYVCSKVHPQVYLTIDISDTQAVLSDLNGNELVFGRQKQITTNVYHNIELTQSGRGQVWVDGQRLYQPERKLTRIDGDELTLRLQTPTSHRLTVMCDGNDVTDQVHNQTLRLHDIVADHRVTVRFDEVRGDANDDARLSVADLAMGIDWVNGKQPTAMSYNGVDIDHNGKVDQNDLTLISDCILSDGGMDLPEHPSVDLGLTGYPNLRWSVCYLGAEHPYEPGDYYAWGEVLPKGKYTKGNYKFHADGDESQITKYTSTDGLTHLDPEDDAAHVQWGDDWRMPSSQELLALAQQCTLTEYSASDSPYNGIAGYELKGPNGNTLFLPQSDALDGYYYFLTLGIWSADLSDNQEGSMFDVFNFVFTSMNGAGSAYRYIGLPILPVREER